MESKGKAAPGDPIRPAGGGERKGPAHPDKGLEDLIQALRSGEEAGPAGAESGPVASEGPAGGPGTGPAKPPGKPGDSATPGAADDRDQAAPGGRMAGYLMKRLEAVEAELARERDRSAEARARLDARDANRGEVEEQIKAISGALKRERESSHARGRIEALESRLDKMHEAFSEALESKLEKLNETWAGMLRELAERKEAASESRGGQVETLKILRMISDQLGALAPAMSEAGRAREESLQRIEQVGMALAGLLDQTAPRLAARLDAAARDIRGLTARLEARVLEAETERVETLAPLFSGALARMRGALKGPGGGQEAERAAELAAALEAALAALRARLREERGGRGGGQ